MKKAILPFTIATMLISAQAHAFAPQCGKASWYAMTSMTASGERASPNSMTAAHRTLRFGTKVRVTNLRNGRSLIVRINDRGPFIKGRIIDVTKRAAQKLGFVGAGWTRIGVSKVDERFEKGGCVTRNAYSLPKGLKPPLPTKRPAWRASGPDVVSAQSEF